MTIKKEKSVAIIGAGFCGLVAAYYLGKRGYDVVVYESEKEIGGLASGLCYDGDFLEKYYHHIFKNDRELLGLITELKLEHNLKWRPSNVGMLYKNKLYSFNGIKDYLVLPALSPAAKMRISIGGLLLARNGLRNDHLTAEEMICKYMGDEAWHGFWKQFFLVKFERFSNKINASWFLARLRSRAASRKGGREVLAYPDGGFWIIIEALHKAIIGQGGKVVIGTPIDLIQNLGDQFVIKNQLYDIVVSTLPPKVTSSIFSAYRSPGVDNIGFVGAIVISKSPFSPYYWTNVLDSEAPFGVLVEHNNLINGLGNSYIYLGKYCESVSKFYQLGEEQIAKIAIEFLEKIKPGYGSQVKEVKVFKDDFAQPIITSDYRQPPYSCDVAGFYTTSMAHIFPEDRGLNQAVAEARKIVDLIDS